MTFRTYGHLDQRGSNAVLVPTWLGGTSADWADLIGPRGILDSAAFFVIVVDALANGLSSSPSNMPGAFPFLRIEDMVESQYRVAHEVLGLRHLRAVVGVSMGGTQAFEWMVAHPDFVDRFVSVVGSPQVTRHDRAWLATVIRVAEAHDLYGVPADTVWRMIAGIGVLLEGTHESVDRRSPAEADSLLAATASAYARGLTPANLAAQARAILAYDLSRRPGSDSALAAERFRDRLLVVNSPDDQLISAAPALAYARKIGADTLVLRSPCGHGVFVCEAATIGGVVRAFLRR